MLFSPRVFCRASEYVESCLCLAHALMPWWREAKTLAVGKNGAEGGSEHSNPAVIHTSDNMVHLVYVTDKKTVKHVVLDPEQF